MAAASFTESLARYAATGEEAAFADVVCVAGPLVWRVAMRRLHDAHLAEEAAQNVFVTLARKARAVAAQPGALAWLHRAATLEAANLARSRARREHRHRVMATEPTLLPAAPLPDDSSPAGAWLDEAIDRLPAADRELLLGRFFEGLSFRELGARTGKTEEAVKKQSQRALERLRKKFGRQGASVTVTTLPALLGAEFSSAALPSALTVSLTSTAVAAATTTTLATAGSLITPIAIAMTTTKALGIASVLLLCLFAATSWQQRRIAEWQGRAVQARERLQARLSGAPGSNGHEQRPAIVFRQEPEDMTLPDPLTGEAMMRAFLRTAARGLNDPGLKSDSHAVSSALEQMSQEDAARLLREIDALSVRQDLKKAVAEEILLHVAARRPEWAMTELAKRGSGWFHLMRAWAKDDPQAAWRWLEPRLARGELVRRGAREGHDPEKILTAAFLENVAKTGPGALRNFLQTQAGAPYYHSLVEAAGAYYLSLEDKGDAFRLLRETDSPETTRRVLAEKLAAVRTRSQPGAMIEEAAKIMSHAGFPPSERQAVLRMGLGHFDFNQDFALCVMAAFSAPEEQADNLAWLALCREARDSKITHFAGSPTESEDRRLVDEAAAATAVALVERGHAELARAYLDRITDERVKTHTTALVEATMPHPDSSPQ